MRDSAQVAKQRLNKDKWKNAPIQMVIKKVVEATGEEGLMVHEEIERLEHELAAKDAALEVLVKDFAKVNNEIVELKRQLAEATRTIDWRERSADKIFAILRDVRGRMDQPRVFVHKRDMADFLIVQGIQPSQILMRSELKQGVRFRYELMHSPHTYGIGKAGAGK